MLVINSVRGNINRLPGKAERLLMHKNLDRVLLYWDELGNRVIRKMTSSGIAVVIAFGRGTRLKDGDILLEDEKSLLIVRVIPEEVLEITTSSLYEMGAACYHLGSRELRAIIEGSKITIPYNRDAELALQRLGIKFRRESRGVDFGAWEACWTGNN